MEKNNARRNRHLINPADIVDGKIAKAHRKIANEFVGILTKERATKIWNYFEADVVEMERYFNRKFGSFYMMWTPKHNKNVFISEWICSRIITKITK